MEMFWEEVETIIKMPSAVLGELWRALWGSSS